MLDSCRKDGGDQVLPFQTPADYLLSMWDLPQSPLKTREYSFLANPRVRAFRAILLLIEAVCRERCALHAQHACKMHAQQVINPVMHVLVD